MKILSHALIALLTALLGLLLVPASWAQIAVQCPGDTDGDAVIDAVDPDHPNAKCMHIAGGDGFATMADGRPLYCFGFSNLTGVKPDMVMMKGMLAAEFPAPTIALDEGDEFYLTLSNVGMMIRPDLFDPHTVHWHGFPNAASIFDGVPGASVSVNMGSSLTYYYKVPPFPGTYMWHCHVEATEHMQMGMLGQLFIRPAQNKLAEGTDLNGFTHHSGYTYCYNDGDGSTYYDVDYTIQLGSFDPAFHDASWTVQPLPFADMKDTYAMLNGRGYPDTTDQNPLPSSPEGAGVTSQKESSFITAAQGQKILLRLSNLNVTRFYTLMSPSIPMTVVGVDARHLRSASGENLYYTTNAVTTGGGQSFDVLLDTSNVESGTYLLYTSNLNYLSNDSEDFGGMMTEIQIN